MDIAQFLRRGVLALTIIAAASAVSSGSQAQDYPTQTIRLVAAFPPGAGSDILVRYFAEKLKPLSSQPIIVENKVGAGGMVASEYVAKAKPDGYTILVHSGITFANMMHMLKKPPIDAAKDIQMVAMINRQPFMLVVKPDRPWKSVGDLTAHLKSQNGKASYGWSATIAKVMGELYKDIAKVDVTEVSYRTGQDMLNDLLGGNLDFAILDPTAAMAQAREGRIRILAVGTRDRIQALPDLPTLQESGVPGVNLVGWFGAMVPAATPRPIVDKLGGWFNQVLRTDDAAKFLNASGSDPWIMSVDEAQKVYLDEVKAWGDYVKLAKIEPQ